MWTASDKNLHLGLAVNGPLSITLILLADEPVRLLVYLLHHRVAHLGVLLQLVARQMFHYTCTDGVSEDVGGGAQSVPEERRVTGEDGRHREDKMQQDATR